jgi:nitrate/nitrite transport system substrate-binding protein
MGRPSGKPQRVRVGFIALTDCAPIVMAAQLGFDRRHGVEIVPTREASWASLRDKLLAGALDMAHALYGLVYGVHLGIGGVQRDMALFMALNRNGQGFTLSRQLAERGAVDAPSLAQLMRREPRDYSFAQTFPTGTHAMWLYYWLASVGINPLCDARILTVPPPQMVDHLQRGLVDGFSVGEPWNHGAVLAGVGITAGTSQDIWPDHPEKVLGTTAAFADAHPDTCRAVTMAVLEACRWIDASRANQTLMAETLAQPQWLGVPAQAILPRVLGKYDGGWGRRWTDPHPMRFFADGELNYPYLSDGMWFMTQYRRWGLLDAHPDYEAVAQQIHRTALYAEAATAVGAGLPASALRSSRLVDGVVWDGSDPARYADGFALHAPLADALAA